MKTNDNQYYIYLRATKLRIPCTKEQFDDYYRDINAYRRTQQNHGRCVCPPSKRLSCDMDCFNCPYHTPGDLSSLDSGRVDDEGEDMNWLDHLQEEIHYTPRHGSWLNIAEIELSALGRQCLGTQRIPDLETLKNLLVPWAADRNLKQRGVSWHFTTDDARTKLRHLYPLLQI